MLIHLTLYLLTWYLITNKLTTLNWLLPLALQRDHYSLYAPSCMWSCHLLIHLLLSIGVKEVILIPLHRVSNTNLNCEVTMTPLRDNTCPQKCTWHDKWCLQWPGRRQWMRPPYHSGQTIAACHVRGIKLFNHASHSEEKKKKKKSVRDNRLNTFECGSICIARRTWGQMSEWSFSNVSWQRVFSPLACNLFSHALSVAGSQLRFLIHNEHGRRQSQAKGGGAGEGGRDNHWHTILCPLQNNNKKNKKECGFKM